VYQRQRRCRFSRDRDLCGLPLVFPAPGTRGSADGGGDECQPEMVLVPVGKPLARVDQMLCVGDSPAREVQQLVYETVDDTLHKEEYR